MHATTVELRLLAGRDYPAMTTYAGRMEIGEFCLMSVPDIRGLFAAMENAVAEQGDTLLRQELWGNGDGDCPYLLKLWVTASPLVWALIPIAIMAVAGAVMTWQVTEAVQTTKGLSWLPILGVAALGITAIYLLK